MIKETKFGSFDLIKDEKECFEVDDFEKRYLKELFDGYEYIVGDYSAGLLRLKGFENNNRAKSHISSVPDYLYESCAYGCAYFILRRRYESQKV